MFDLNPWDLAWQVRLPDERANDLEGALAAANERRRNRAVDRLQNHFEGIEPKSLSSGHDGQPQLGRRRAPAGKDPVETVMDRMTDSYLTCNPPHALGLVSSAAPPITRRSHLAAAETQGLPVALDGGHELLPVQARAADDLATITQARTAMSIMCSRSPDHVLHLPGDGHRLIEILSGSLRVSLWPPAVNPDKAASLWSGSLEAGRCLLIPDGWSAELRGTAGWWSVTAIVPVTQHHVTAQLRRTALAQPLMRRSLTIDGALPAQGELDAALKIIDLEEVQTLALGSWLAMIAPLGADPWPDDPAGQPWEVSAPGGWLAVSRRSPDAVTRSADVVSVAIGGQVLTGRSADVIALTRSDQLSRPPVTWAVVASDLAAGGLGLAATRC